METRKAFAVLFVLLSAGVFAADVTTKTVPSGMLVDATGKKIGHFYPRDISSGTVLTYLDGKTTYFGVWFTQDGSRTYLPGGGYETVVFYESADCTGQAYIYPGMYSPVLQGPNNQHVAFVGRATASNFDAQSYKFTMNSCDVDNGGVQTLTPADPVDLGAVFAPPYTLR